MAHNFSATCSLLDEIARLARQAGDIACDYFARVQANLNTKHTGIAIRFKDDNSLLSEADIALDRFIATGLARLTPKIPVISEESTAAHYNNRKHWPWLWLVDPLDGTRHFLAGKPDYTINIALVKDSTPVLGVIYAPSHHRCYMGLEGQGAWLLSDSQQAPQPAKRLRCSNRRHNWLDVMVSHGIPGWKLRGFLAQQPAWLLHPLGSALKSCWIAEGLADVYPRFGHTCEWDTAAAQIILNEAGGHILDQQGNPLRYNKPDFLNPEFIACSDWFQPSSGWY